MVKNIDDYSKTNVKYERFCRFATDTDTGNFLFYKILIDRYERLVFFDLCGLVSNDFNSFKYNSTKELYEMLGLKRTRAKALIHKFILCNLIRRENNYIYINPAYYTGFTSIKNKTFKMFEETTVQYINNRELTISKTGF